jgi:hypothetical protein
VFFFSSNSFLRNFISPSIKRPNKKKSNKD